MKIPYRFCMKCLVPSKDHTGIQGPHWCTNNFYQDVLVGMPYVVNHSTKIQTRIYTSVSILPAKLSDEDLIHMMLSQSSVGSMLNTHVIALAVFEEIAEPQGVFTGLVSEDWFDDSACV